MKRACLVAAAAALLVGVIAPTARAVDNPATLQFLRGLQRSRNRPGGSPPGANNWHCTPSAAHPRPVVLVHGTFGSMNTNMGAVSQTLARAGYCVFALNYGGPPRFGGHVYGTGSVRRSAQQLSAFTERVLAGTHATQVDMVGHSQGGMMPRWYMKFLGGAPKVHTLVGLSPSNHGTSFESPFPSTGSPNWYEKYCAACADQAAGSSFMQELNAGGDTLPGVDYTVIETRYDEVVVPNSSTWLSGPRVTNILLQDVCPLDFSEHLNIAFSPNALALVRNALDPAHATKVACQVVLPLLS